MPGPDTYPWEGAALAGTTDVDHRDGSKPPLATAAEFDDLLAALRAQLPPLDLSRGDLVSAFAGVQPVVAGGHADPSKEASDWPLFAAVVPPQALGALGADPARRLLGRHGRHTAALLAAAQPGELGAVPGTPTLWAELRCAACAESAGRQRSRRRARLKDLR